MIVTSGTSMKEFDMDEEGNLDEQLSMLAQGAAMHHEVFKTYVAAGFTEHQALKLIALMITNSNQEGEPE